MSEDKDLKIIVVADRVDSFVFKRLKETMGDDYIIISEKETKLTDFKSLGFKNEIPGGVIDDITSYSGNKENISKLVRSLMELDLQSRREFSAIAEIDNRAPQHLVQSNKSGNMPFYHNKKRW